MSLSVVLPTAIHYVVGVASIAYIGPGATGGAIAVVLGVIGSIILAIFSLLWYPFKRIFRMLRTHLRPHDDSVHASDE